MKQLPIYKHPRIWALVDDEDYASARRFIWHVTSLTRRNSEGVVKRRHYLVWTPLKDGERRVSLQLSRLVTKARPEQRVRHITTNYLDCRKGNLSISGKMAGEPDFYETLASVKMTLMSENSKLERKIWLNTPIPNFANKVYDHLIFLEDQEIARRKAALEAIAGINSDE